LNMHHSAAKFGPRLLTNDQSLWLTTTWLLFPIPPTCWTKPHDFALFPKLKTKLKGRQFEAVYDIQW
jgi:hypothetical protein